MNRKFINRFFKKQILGIDIGERTIKGVKLKKDRGGRVKLVSHFFQDLSEISKNFPDQVNVSEALKATLETHRLDASHAATAVRDHHVMSFLLDLPNMSDKELAQVIPQEIAEQTKIDIENHTFDYALSPTLSKLDGMTAIKAYCIKRDVVLEKIENLKLVGLKASSVESEMMAITAMLKFNDYINPEEVTVVLDLGESHLTAGLITDGALSIVRTQEIAFGSLNRSLQDFCNVSYHAAEKIKLTYDFLAPVEAGNTVSEVLSENYFSIFQAVKETLDFYRESARSDGRIDRILLVGGGSQLTCVGKTLETIFRIPNAVVNPFRNIDIFNAKDADAHESITRLAPYMSLAVGLALTAVSEEDVA